MFPYLVVRLLVGLVRLLPLRAAWTLGAVLGRVGWWILPGYRRLARHNLRIAFPDQPAAARNAIARLSFSRFGANLLCGLRTAFMRVEEFRDRIDPASLEKWGRAMREPNARGRGALALLSHLGCWEMWARVSALVPGLSSGTIYQALRNPRLEAWVRRLRAAHGLELFDRKTGFHAPAAFVRAGNALGVLADQHAGDGGVWTPFFGRLASTSPLAAIIARRAGVPMIPTAMVTAGPARWRVLIGTPLTPRPGEPAAALTARVNAALEEQIAASPADWFWVHNRWKTPKPHFLLTATKRGVAGDGGPKTRNQAPPHAANPTGAPPPLNQTGAAEVTEEKSPLVSAPDLQGPDFRARHFRLLVRSPNWLGDAVMAEPAVRAMAAGRPDGEVTVLAPEKVADFWRAVPAVTAVIAIPAARRGVLAVASLVRKAGPFDAAVLLPNSLRSAAEVRLAGVPRRVGFAGHSRSRLLNQVVLEPVVPPGPERPHHAARYLHLARGVGAPEVSLLPERPLPRDSGTLPGERGKMRIALCPGAEYGPTKRWPADRFAEAAKLLVARSTRTVRFVLVGTAQDAPAGAIIEAALGAESCENLLGKTTLAQLIETLHGCDALLTNDTGTMHLAAFLGVPLAAVFGSTDPQATGPLAAPDRARVLRRQVECSPCFLKECPLDLRCLHAVTPAEAAAAVLELVR